MKNLFKKLYILFAGAIVASTIAIPLTNASEPRDYDSNAIIYGGAYTITELVNKVNNGVNNSDAPHQTSAELKDLFEKIHMSSGWFGQLQSGTIYKDGHVELNGRTVATGVQTMGRHYIPGSTRDYSVPYPVYWRNPSVSFNSNSIPAWVFMNYDGTMGFGLVKSCGNPIKTSTGIRIRPKYNLTIRKWEDLNGNQHKDTNEGWLSGWTFSVTGNGVNKSVTTGSDGSVTVSGLYDGSYIVTETLKDGWRNTTNKSMTAVINGRNGEIWFGNQRITHNLEIRKYEDANGDNHRQETERFLSGWSFRVRGTNYDKTFTTNSNGSISVTGLLPGHYTIDETAKSGWRTITNPHQDVNLTSNQTIYFGNQLITHSLEIRKFEDLNNNKTKQSNESYLPGWSFTVKGDNFNREYKTDSKGSIIIRNLVPGKYTITETQKTGWTSTTGLTQTINLTANQIIQFGNRKIPITPQSKFAIRARKFEDVNGNGKRDEDEPWLEGWNIRVRGNGVDKTLVTNDTGTVVFSELEEGTYTVNEEMKDGWKNITPLSQTVTIPDKVNLEGYAEFGNQKISTPTPVTPSGSVTPTPLPTSGPEEAVMGAFGGVSLAGMGIYFRRGKKLLKAAYKKF
jgi:hypothetical protein